MVPPLEGEEVPVVFLKLMGRLSRVLMPRKANASASMASPLKPSASMGSMVMSGRAFCISCMMALLFLPPPQMKMACGLVLRKFKFNLRLWPCR